MKPAIGWLKTRQVADLLGLSTDDVVGEIKDGRLKGRVRTRPSGRTSYRIEPEALAEYKAQYWKRVELTTAAPSRPATVIPPAVSSEPAVLELPRAA